MVLENAWPECTGGKSSAREKFEVINTLKDPQRVLNLLLHHNLGSEWDVWGGNAIKIKRVVIENLSEICRQVSVK